MRTTVDLAPAMRQRVLLLARQQNRSLSSVVADLVARGLAQLDEPLALRTDERSGFPVLSIGRQVTSADVAAALDEE